MIRPNRKNPRCVWAKYTTERLLDLRMCDLDLSIEGTVLEERIDKIRQELGWQPQIPELERIIDSAWKWHHSHPMGYDD